MVGKADKPFGLFEKGLDKGFDGQLMFALETTEKAIVFETHKKDREDPIHVQVFKINIADFRQTKFTVLFG